LPPALEVERLPLLEDEAVVGTAGPAACGADIDAGGLGPSVAEQGSRGLGVVGVGVEVGRARQVAELVRRHVEAEIALGLRAYAAQSNILPEQTLGRGLRRMYMGTDVTEYVSVIGTPAFMEFVESIQNEGVELERTAMGGAR